LAVKEVRMKARASLALLVLALAVPAAAQDTPHFRNEVIMQVPLEHLEPGNYALRMTVTTIEPYGTIPAHVHEFGGVRYVLEGAITIAWKDGRTQTFAQGSTYYEGPGQNHPAETMAASNPGEKPTKILLVELAPAN